MKKVLCTAALASLAIVVLPIASASANPKFKGKCEVQGLAKFGKLSFNEPETKEFSFTSSVQNQGALTGGFAGKKSVRCTGEGENAEPKASAGVEEFTGAAEVNTAALGAKVEGLLSCANSRSKVGEPAKAELVLENGLFSGAAGKEKVKLKVKLAFKSAKVLKKVEVEQNKKLGELDLTLENKLPSVKGAASFAEAGNESEKAANVAKCLKGELIELPFDAVFPAEPPVLAWGPPLGPEFTPAEATVESE